MHSRFAFTWPLALMILLAGCAPRRSRFDGGGDLDAGSGSDAHGLPGDGGATAPDMPMSSMCAGGPLALPIAGCMPPVLASSGDPHQDCVDRINEFRAQCQCLPPLMRWRSGEACADQDAMYDGMRMSAHAGFIDGICGSGNGENECPGWTGWSSVSMTISECLQSMWDEGPGDFYGPPEHGHYINMSSTSFTMVACGFYTGSGGVTATQNFQ